MRSAPTRSPSSAVCGTSLRAEAWTSPSVHHAERSAADTTELDVLVLEMACTSGEDAQGRIVEPTVVHGSEALTVVFATVPHDGSADCEITPETPFVLELPEPFGDRMLLDRSSIPPRDATTCHPRVCP